MRITLTEISAYLLALLLFISSVQGFRYVDVNSTLCTSQEAGTCIVNATRTLNCTALTPADATVLQWPWASDAPPVDVCVINYNGPIVLSSGAGIFCQRDPTVCQLWFNVTALTVVDEGSSIAANTIIVNASAVYVGTGSSISTSDLGLLYGPAPGSSGAGGSYGGTGGGVQCFEGSGDSTSRADTSSARSKNLRTGVTTPNSLRITQCCDLGYFYAFSNASVGSFSHPDADWDGAWGGGSGVGGGSPRAGGRVWIAAAALAMDGEISADGKSGQPASIPGSGSGGTILLDVGVLTPWVNNTGYITCNGGIGEETRGAGGGGRVVIRYDTLSLPVTSISAFGGGVLNEVPKDPACSGGAAGTIYFSQRIPGNFMPDGSPVRYNTLRVANNGLQALAVTPLWVDSSANRTDMGNSSGPTTIDSGEQVDAVVLTGTSYVASMRLVLRRLFSALAVPAPVLASSLSRGHDLDAALAWAASTGARGEPRHWESGEPYDGDVDEGQLQEHMPLGQRTRSRMMQRRALVLGSSAGSMAGPVDLPAVPVAGLSVSQSFLLPLVDSQSPPPVLINGTSANLTISAGEVELTASTLLVSGAPVWISSGNITLVVDSIMLLEQVLLVMANNTAYVDCRTMVIDAGGAAAARYVRVSGGTELVAGTFAVRAGRSVYIGPDASIACTSLLLYSDGNITINGALVTENAPSRVCRFDATRREGCKESDWAIRSPAPPALSFNSILAARAGVVEITANGKFETDVGMICAQSIAVVGSSVSAVGKGCLPGAGVGAGAASVTGSGAGGGHASAGGDAVDGAAGGAAYDNPHFPLFVGSGAGGSGDGGGGQGGGYLVLEGVSQVFLASSTEVSCAGADGYSEGGGAGGSLLVRTFQLTGQGALSVEGGGSYVSGGGGGGSGGMLKLQSTVLAPAAPAAVAGTEAAQAHEQARLADALHARVVHALVSAHATLNLALQGESYGGKEVLDLLASLQSYAHALDALSASIASQYEVVVHRMHSTVAQGELGGAERWREALLEAMHAIAATNAILSGAMALTRVCASGARAHACAPLRTRLSRMHAHAVSEAKAPSPFVWDINLADVASGFSGTLILTGGKGASTGGFPGGPGTLDSPLCQAGTARNARAQCIPCGLGAWRNSSSDAPLVCQPCANAPARGSYTNTEESSAACAYVCPPSTLYPACDTSYEALVADFGGALNFFLSLGGVIIVVGAALLCVHRQRALAVRDFKRSEGVLVSKGGRGSELGSEASSPGLTGSGASGGRGRSRGGYGAAAPAPGERFGLFLGSAAGAADGKDRFDIAVATLQGGCGTLSTGDAGWSRHWARMRSLASRASGASTLDFLISACALQEADLTRHATRIYLGGTNTLGSSWRLPWEAPRSLRPFVRSEPFARLAERVNEVLQWPRLGWEEVTYLALRACAPPLAHAFLKGRQRLRSVLLMQLILASDRADSWLRGAKASLLSDAVRVSVSGDLSTAYIDILKTDRRSLLRSASGVAGIEAWGGEAGSGAAACDPHAVPNSLSLPLVLLLAGDGTLLRPLHLDANDLLLRSVPSVPGLTAFIDADWIEFIAEFNARARLMMDGAILQTSGPVLDLLGAVSSAPDLLGGLAVELVRVWPVAQSYVDGPVVDAPSMGAGMAADDEEGLRAHSGPTPTPTPVQLAADEGAYVSLLRAKEHSFVGSEGEGEGDGEHTHPEGLFTPKGSAVAWTHTHAGRGGKSASASTSPTSSVGEGEEGTLTPLSLAAEASAIGVDGATTQPYMRSNSAGTSPTMSERESEAGARGRRAKMWWASGLASLQEDVVGSNECRLGLLISRVEKGGEGGGGMYPSMPFSSAPPPPPASGMKTGGGGGGRTLPSLPATG